MNDAAASAAPPLGEVGSLAYGLGPGPTYVPPDLTPADWVRVPASGAAYPTWSGFQQTSSGVSYRNRTDHIVYISSGGSPVAVAPGAIGTLPSCDTCMFVASDEPAPAGDNIRDLTSFPPDSATVADPSRATWYGYGLPGAGFTVADHVGYTNTTGAPVWVRTYVDGELSSAMLVEPGAHTTLPDCASTHECAYAAGTEDGTAQPIAVTRITADGLVGTGSGPGLGGDFQQTPGGLVFTNSFGRDVTVFRLIMAAGPGAPDGGVPEVVRVRPGESSVLAGCPDQQQCWYAATFDPAGGLLSGVPGPQSGGNTTAMAMVVVGGSHPGDPPPQPGTASTLGDRYRSSYRDAVVGSTATPCGTQADRVISDVGGSLGFGDFVKNVETSIGHEKGLGVGGKALDKLSPVGLVLSGEQLAQGICSGDRGQQLDAAIDIGAAAVSKVPVLVPFAAAGYGAKELGKRIAPLQGADQDRLLSHTARCQFNRSLDDLSPDQADQLVKRYELPWGPAQMIKDWINTQADRC